MKVQTWFVLVNIPRKGTMYIGPFDTFDAACKYAESKYLSWSVHMLTPVAA